jgi:hypothetical protein
MSLAVAAIAPSTLSTTTEAATPTVFVNGVPDPSLSVVSAMFVAPLDDRQAMLRRATQDTNRLDAYRDAELTVAIPHALSDGEVRWQVLLSGSVARDDHDRSSGTDTSQQLLRDRLSNVLNQSVDTLGPWDVGPLSLGALLDRLANLIDADLVLACDPASLDGMVQTPSPQTQSIASRLEPVLAEWGLSIAQSLEMVGQQVRRTLTVLPWRSGRRVALPWSDGDGRGGLVTSVSVDRQVKPPRLWIAQGDRPVVEDTFVLQPGWDAMLEGQPDSDYGRLTSSDFSRFGSVYRAWVLNEDGGFDGAAFDAGELFDRPGSIRSSLRFGLCLTRDTSGRRLSPVIESSTDSGATWAAYPGQADVVNDRAGVLLTDDDLPGAILSAAKAGTLRLRVTATLTSPQPIESRRWDGNPFAGPAPTQVIDFDDQYAWRFVAPTSIHRVGLDSGTLQADTVDDRRALRQRLLAHLARQPGPEITARVDLAGAWTALRTGDRVADALGRGVALDGNPSSFATRDACIQRIDLTFSVARNAPRTRLRLD